MESMIDSCEREKILGGEVGQDLDVYLEVSELPLQRCGRLTSLGSESTDAAGLGLIFQVMSATIPVPGSLNWAFASSPNNANNNVYSMVVSVCQVVDGGEL